MADKEKTENTQTIAESTNKAENEAEGIEQRSERKPGKRRTENRTPTKYRDERGVRKQAYRRFKEDVDYLPIDQDKMVASLEFQLLVSKRIGRPPIFETVEELQQEIQDYWEYILKANKEKVTLIPDVEGLASYLCISREALNEWERSNYKGFSATIKATKNSIAAVKKQMAMNGEIPTIVFATDFNNNHGYTQKQEVVVTPNQPLGELQDPQIIAERYAELPED